LSSIATETDKDLSSSAASVPKDEAQADLVPNRALCSAARNMGISEKVPAEACKMCKSSSSDSADASVLDLSVISTYKYM
jgi:hypothetical protein